MNYIQIIYKKEYCSKKCLQNDPIYKQNLLNKRTKTCLTKYGVPYAISDYKNRKQLSKKEQLIATKKRKETCLNKYGVDCNFKTKEFKEKSKKTCLQKYGVDNPTKSELIKLKIKNTNNHKTIKEKQQILNKTKNTNLQKYGVTHFTKNPTLNYLQNLKNRRRKQLWNTILSYSDYIIPLFTIDDLCTITSKKIYKWKCVLCRKHILYTYSSYKFYY